MLGAAVYLAEDYYRDLNLFNSWLKLIVKNNFRIRPTYLDALMGLASLVAMDTGKGEEGWRLMLRALEEAPLNPDVHNNAGALLLRIGGCGWGGHSSSLVVFVSGRPKDALSAYEKALQLDPGHVTALTSLGRVYRSLGQDSKAEDLFRRYVCSLEVPIFQIPV